MKVKLSSTPLKKHKRLIRVTFTLRAGFEDWLVRSCNGKAKTTPPLLNSSTDLSALRFFIQPVFLTPDSYFTKVPLGKPAEEPTGAHR